MKQLFSTSFLFLFFAQSFAQSSHQYDFPLVNTSSASKLLATSDGGYLAVGSDGDGADATRSDIVLMKMNANQTTIWAKSYSTPPYVRAWCQFTMPRMEYAVDAVEVSDGYVILGCYDHYEDPNFLSCAPNNYGLNGRFDIIVTKINKSTGAVLWAKRYGDIDNQFGTSIQSTKDGGFIIGGMQKPSTILDGNYSFKPFFLKIDATGAVQWTRIQDNFSFQFIPSLMIGGFRMPITELSSGGYVYAASTGYETHIVKLNGSGNTVWGKIFYHGGSNGGMNAGTIGNELGLLLGAGYVSSASFPKITELSNGNLLLLGNFNLVLAAIIGGIDPNTANIGLGSLGYNAGFVLETSSVGAYINSSLFWHETGNTSGNIWDLSVSDLDVMSNGNVLITGSTSYQSFTMEYNRNATTDDTHALWAKRGNSFAYSSVPLGYDMPSTIIKGSNGLSLADQFYVSQTPLNAAGDACHPNLVIHSVKWAPGVDLFTFAPVFSSLNASANLTLNVTNLAVTPQTLCSTPMDIATAAASYNISIFPNPVKDNTLTLSWDAQTADEAHIQILDIAGKVVFSSTVSTQSGLNTFQIQPPLSSGVYFISLENEEGRAGKIFLKD